jgi:hypothetical protein
MFRNVPLRVLIQRVQAFLNSLLLLVLGVIPRIHHLCSNALFERIEAIRGVHFHRVQHVVKNVSRP